MRTIRVTGKGRVSVKPDLIRINISTSGIYTKYEDAIRVSAEQTRVLRETLEKSGLDSKDLKTTSFEIDTSYESYRDKHENYKRRFLGYEFSHSTYIKFSNDNELLGRVLYQLSTCPLDVTFDIEHTISNPEEVKNELLKNSIIDSKNKAKILADSSGVKLGDIINIDYSWKEIKFSSRPLRNIGLNESVSYQSEKSFDIDIEPDDLDLSDSVTVIWEIV